MVRSSRTALGRLLQERREALGYSRVRAGEAAGIRPGTIEGWELGRVAKPPIHDVLRLARLLRISTAEVEQAVLGDEEGLMPIEADRPAAGADGVSLLEQVIGLFGWSDEQVAAALGVSTGRVGGWRSGAEQMGLPELMTLAALLGLHAAGGLSDQRSLETAARALAGRAAHPSRSR